MPALTADNILMLKTHEEGGDPGMGNAWTDGQTT